MFTISYAFRYDASSDVMRMSMTEFYLEDLSLPGRLIITTLSSIGLLHREDIEVASTSSSSSSSRVATRVNNMTLINLCLKLFGPMHERTLTMLLLAIQVVNTVAAFGIRFFLAGLVYEHVH